jgi:hypothetical protein
MDDWKEQLRTRIASYVVLHPQEKVKDIARKFGVDRTTLGVICKQSGVKRKQGRKKWHCAAKAQ